MPVFLLSLLGGLVSIAASMVGRVLIALGIGYVTYSGISVLLDTLKAQVVSRLSGASVEFVQVMSLVKIDVCVSILFSAMTARLLLQGLTSDKITKMVIK
ncbi:conserved protein of unknown function (plasmid) [Cupriavidus taiwanensis]|uniref:DUF2523 domain-containing protein n=1 Tax=Cupriavidus taiwanensis TaxID=164546 RepID=A0A9Q7V1J6_9BURK|nr:DUF2523 domain-containing protein [Cupriavidus taiwanensis]SPD67820.1 conserved protein of unknown function [Cupriavidus taiwanensis]